MKRVTTLIRRSPFNSVVPTEALRMSLGLTLTNNEVAVVFAGDGVYLLVSPNPEAIGLADVKRHLATLKDLGCSLVAEEESLKERGLFDRNIGVDRRTRQEIWQLIQSSHRVIGF